MGIQDIKYSAMPASLYSSYMTSLFFRSATTYMMGELMFNSLLFLVVNSHFFQFRSGQLISGTQSADNDSSDCTVAFQVPVYSNV